MEKQNKNNKEENYRNDTLNVSSNGQGFVTLSDCGSVLDLSTNLKNQSNANLEDENSYLEKDFIIVPFRMLSKTLIQGHWLDFSYKNVLKNAISLFGGVTVYKNHKPDVDDWVGVTLKPTWSTVKGIEGIDAPFKIDMKSNEKIVRGLQMKPPAIHSVSVGIRFEAVKSHPDLEYFWIKLGQNIDGHIVRLIIKKITRITEVSLVHAGADKHAKKLSVENSNQNIKTIESVKENKQKMKIFKTMIERLGIKPVKLGFAEGDSEKELSNDALETLLELAANELLKVKERINQFASLFDLEEINSTFEITEEISKLKEVLKVPKQELLQLRESTKKAYLQSVDGVGDHDMLSVIERSNLGALSALAKEFNVKLDKKHPLKCNDCQSLNVTRASSELEEPQTDKPTNLNTGFPVKNYS